MYHARLDVFMQKQGLCERLESLGGQMNTVEAAHVVSTAMIENNQEDKIYSAKPHSGYRTSY